MTSPAVLANNTLVKLGGTDLSSDMNQVKLTMKQAIIDASVFSVTGWKEKIVSISEWMVSIAGFFDKATSKIDATLYAMFGAPASATTFEVDIPNSSTGSVRYTGNVWATTYPIDDKVNDAVKFSADLEGTGALTRAII